MQTSLMATYAPSDIAFEHGAGVYLFDSKGKKYLDFSAGVAVLSLGHCHPYLVDVLIKQAKNLWHTSNLFHIAEQEKLAQRLAQNSFADRVFFTNSGAESVECGLKVARRYHDVNGDPERYRVVTFEGAFHGRTLATMAAGQQKRHLAGFGPPLDGFDQVEYGNLKAARSAVTANTAAILVEPIQGEAGARVPPKGFLRGLREICDESGLLLFVDEIQTGIGRSGHLFAYQQEEILPDIISLAKGLGSGFPVGACMTTEKASEGMTAGTHGSTFGGNPLAMAVGNGVLDVILAPGFLKNVQELASKFFEMLSELVQKNGNFYTGLTGAGFLLGLQCKHENNFLITKLLDHGLLVAKADNNTIRLLPPLIVEETHLQEAINILQEVVE